MPSIGPITGPVSTPAHPGLHTVSWVSPISQLNSINYQGAISVASVAILGTLTARTVANTNYATSKVKCSFVTAAGANSTAGIANNVSQAWRGDAVGRGGLTFISRFHINATIGTLQVLVGLSFNAGNLTGDPSAGDKFVAIACDAGDANLQFMHHGLSGSTTKVDLGSGYAKSSLTNVYEVIISADPNSTVVSFTVRRCDDATIAPVTYQAIASSTALPATNVLLYPKFWVANGATGGAVDLALMTWYLETP